MHDELGLDRYYTPKKFVFELMKELDLQDNDNHVILEPCAGDLSIVRAIKEYGLQAKFITNDLDPKSPAKNHYNARRATFWKKLQDKYVTWVISNPPFNCATEIITQGYRLPLEGMAMYLRLSWLAPEGPRAAFIQAHPPTQLIIMSRYSFSGNGKVDSITGAWFIWYMDGYLPEGKKAIKVVYTK